jgi:1,4-dihydroxy-6-naphthoate synthase
MKFSIGISPCPNDTYIFDALLNGKIDTAGIQFDLHLEDVQTLNQWALEGRLDFSKISYGVLPRVVNHYLVLGAGGALGYGVGPLLVATQYTGSLALEDIQKLLAEEEVAIPGEDTTAHFLFRQAFPDARRKIFMRFDEIEQWVLEGNGPGVLIHENRFTYEERGLTKLMDLGEYWQQTTGKPIPLGGIVAKKSIDRSLINRVDELIAQSIAYANARFPALPPFVIENAREMEDSVMQKHISLYVNDFSLYMGAPGREAVKALVQALAGETPPDEDLFAATLFT